MLSSCLYKKYTVTSGVDKASADPMVPGVSVWVGGHQTYETLKFIVGSFRLDSVLLKEGSVLEPCMRCVSNPRPVMYATSSNVFVSRSYVIHSDTLQRFYRTLRFSKQLSCFCAGGSGFECGNGDRLRGLFFFSVISSVPPGNCSENWLKRNLGIVKKLSLAELCEVWGLRSAFR